MNRAQKLYEEILPVFEKYEPKMEHISQMPQRGIDDVLNKKEWGYYQWLACLVKVKKPIQFIELGGAMGVACVSILSELPKTSTLFSITLPENKLEFSFIKRPYFNFRPVLGDDLDLAVWPEDCVLGVTDIWFIDTKHEEAHLKKEFEIYKPFFKKGAIILLDDIKLNEGMYNVWKDIVWDKYDAPLHFSRFGICVV